MPEENVPVRRKPREQTLDDARLRRLVEIDQHIAAEDQVERARHRLPVAGPFDLIFCRNVLIYFDDASKSRVIERLLARLSPDGHIFLGHSESLSRWTDRVRSVGPTIYVPLSEEVRDARARR